MYSDNVEQTRVPVFQQHLFVSATALGRPPEMVDDVIYTRLDGWMFFTKGPQPFPDILREVPNVEINGDSISFQRIGHTVVPVRDEMVDVEL